MYYYRWCLICIKVCHTVMLHLFVLDIANLSLFVGPKRSGFVVVCAEYAVRESSQRRMASLSSHMVVARVPNFKLAADKEGLLSAESAGVKNGLISIQAVELNINSIFSAKID